MKRFFIFFVILAGGFLYLFLAFLNLRLELENSGLREKRLILERDRKLIILEISQVSSVKNLTEVYNTNFNSPGALTEFSFLNDAQLPRKLSDGLEVSQKERGKKTKESLIGNEIVPFFSVSQRNR
ncbi:MAG: hypothetical protein ABIK81_00200 [candidate division WOR-3 bacterium]